MPAPIKITLDKQERKQLQNNLKSGKTPVRLVERSKIVLMAADGMPNTKIAEALDIDVNKVGRWRNRYAEKGIKGIEKDLPRGANHGGKDTLKQARLRSKIIKVPPSTNRRTPPTGAHGV